MLKEIGKRKFNNGIVYILETEDGYKIEVTDTYLPFYTKNAINEHQNKLKDYYIADRTERWMIGVSCMSGCPVKCKFCATSKLKKYRNLTYNEIVEQVDFIINKNKKYDFNRAKEHKINYTRMGEPFLNIENVKEAIKIIEKKYINTHHYISTIGIKNSDFSFIKNNITLQLSIHSLHNKKRNWLIPFKNKLNLLELGNIRTESNLKITLNMTLIDGDDFDVELLKKYFNKEYFFVKLSPINKNEISEFNKLGDGYVKGVNLI